MRATLNKYHRFFLCLLGAIILCFISLVATNQPTFATAITKKQVKKVGSFKAERYGIQGGTVTKDYFIFADKDQGQNGYTTIRFFNRRTKKEVRPGKSLIKQEFLHSSSIYHKWGSDFAHVTDANSGKWWCFSVKDKKQVANSKCGSRLSSSSLDHGSNSYYRQGWTKYGSYFFRAYSGSNGNDVNIEVYDKNRKFVENFTADNGRSGAMPACEIEDVAVDGSEGVLYVLCDGKSNGHAAEFYKIDKSVFSKYISPSSSSSSSSPEERQNSISAVRKKTAEDYQREASSYTPSTSTYDGVVETNFFGTMQDDKEGCGVYTTLDLVMTILTIGIGIAAAIGITISGIIYLTAKGDVAKTTKAKRRIYEIVIGLAAYAVIWFVLAFLLPEFNPELKACKILTAEEIAARNARIEATRAENQSKQQSSSKTSRTPSSSGSSSSSSNSLSNWYKAMNDQAKYMKNAKYGGNYKSNFKLSKKEGTCVTYVSTSLQRLGVIPKNTYVWYNCGLTGSAANYIKKHKDVFEVIYPNKTASELKKQKNGIQKGDIVFYQYGSKCGAGHTMIFIKFNKKGKPLFNTFGKSGMKKNNAHPDGSKKIKMIIRLKKTTL